MKIYPLLALLTLSSCANIQKDIYFRSAGSKLGEVSKDGPTPGSSVTLKGPTFSNGYSSTYVSVNNRSNGVYLFGIIIPIIPVFLFGDEKFELEPTQKLSLRCSTWVYVIKDAEKKWYMYESERPCKEFQVLVDNKPLKPVSADIHGNFFFDIEAASVKNIIINKIVINDGKGPLYTFDEKIELKLESKVHYYFLKLAP